MTFLVDKSGALIAIKSFFAGKKISAAAIACVVGVCTAFGIVLVGSYRATEELAVQTSTSIGALVEQDITRNIELFDLSLQAVIEGIDNPKVMALEPSLRQLALFDRSATAEGLGSILVVNEEGNVVLDSRTTKLPEVNLADRDYFQVHKLSPAVGLYISRPFQSRVRGGEWSIGITRRLSRSDGSFAGVIIGAISLSYFQQVFAKIELGKGSEITLLSDDGFFVARYPYMQSIVGQKVSAKSAFLDYAGKATSGFFRNKALDDVTRLYSFHKIHALPLMLVVGLSADEVFGDWWGTTVAVGTAFFSLCVMILVLASLVERELRRRKQIESELALLAVTDPLTGVYNRRSFDERLNLEWARARRTGHLVCMLMVDVDFFKSYNDQFGHQSGDEALKEIAACLQSKTKRPADFVARYGGEEFAVLLPNTDATGAKHVAELIRAGVESLDLTCSAIRHQKLTVSVGVGAAYPSDMDNVSKLIREADRALYVAKAAGRNCVRNSRAVGNLALVSAENG